MGKDLLLRLSVLHLMVAHSTLFAGSWYGEALNVLQLKVDGELGGD